MRIFTAYIEYDPETESYIGIVPGVPGAHTVGDTLDELHANLKEVLQLCMEELDEPLDDLPESVGTIVVAV